MTTHHLTTNKVALCPDALEFLEGSRILACACYHLDTSTSIKSGSLDLYRVPEILENRLHLNPQLQESEQAHAPLSLKCSSSVNSKAIFDVRWRKQYDSSTNCAVVTAEGGVNIYRLNDELNNAPSLEQLSCIELDPLNQPSALSALYVNWLDGLSLTVALSNGGVSKLSLVSDALSIVSSWTAHSLGGCPIEVWVSESDPRNSNVVWTGADDNLLKGWDTRSLSTPSFVSKDHTAGVTSIKWNPFVEHIVATGSYDECLRIWDERYMSKGPVSVLSDLGGGVWRLKWHPSEAKRSFLAAACMLGGAHVIDTALGVSPQLTQEGTQDSGSIELGHPRKIFSYKEHKSLVYAAEWIQSERVESKSAKSKTNECIASCSFYEKEFHTWSFDCIS